MSHNSKATLPNLPNVTDFIGLPLQLMKANPNLLTELLCPSTGYMERVKEVYNYKKTTNKTQTNDGYVMDRLTLILDIDDTILTQFKWTDILDINQEIEYDNQTATITELHYVVQTQKSDATSNDSDNDNEIGNVSCITTDKNRNNYLAHVTSEAHEIPIIGGYINGKEILNVSVYQIVIELQPDSPSPRFGSITKTLTIDTDLTQYDVSYSITTSNEMETPVPAQTIIIDINDDIDKVNKISIDNILKQCTDDIIKVNDTYIAIRPHVHEFLYKSQRVFDDIILFTTNKRECMEGIIKSVHNYLIDKLSKNKKEFNKKNKCKLWKDVKYRDYCDINSESLVKNICKFGVDFSRIIQIDWNEKYMQGFEPNCIQINKYIMNNNDNELMDKIWPILFECSKYNDIRYGLLGKQNMTNTNPISIQSDSLAQTMQYLVELQFIYFKTITNMKNNNSMQFNDEYNDSSVYTTDDSDYYQQQTDSDTETEQNQQEYMNEYGINKHNNNNVNAKIEPSFSCSSVFTDIGDIFNNMSSFFAKSVSK